MADRIYYPNAELAKTSYCNSMDQYKKMHEKSIKQPEEFWSKIAKQFYWETTSSNDKFFSYNFNRNEGDIFIKWMEGASTNISFNLLDKNVKCGNGDKIAFYWATKRKKEDLAFWQKLEIYQQ
ncbi:hypothetical protein KQX54_009809 [Cotesia glomerata]|uniref:Acetyl-coenzyme A synthetase N-terminal domain-containing protein n=1 Tax=Cotesia glomerata TaxID=32391 RepID=A0AAV7HU08_COTGL|nr:hypothetical protein KQX54_009809 [Cotesia glomerata]